MYLSSLESGGAQKPGMAPSAAILSRDPRPGTRVRQSVVEEVEKIEKVVRFGAFWCILMHTTSDKMSENRRLIFTAEDAEVRGGLIDKSLRRCFYFWLDMRAGATRRLLLLIRPRPSAPSAVNNPPFNGSPEPRCIRAIVGYDCAGVGARRHI